VFAFRKIEKGNILSRGIKKGGSKNKEKRPKFMPSYDFIFFLES